MKRKTGKERVMKFALGTGSSGVAGSDKTVASPWLGLAGNIPMLADGIISMLENNPNAYSKQPNVNASTMKSMVSPYSFATGGQVGQGLGEDELAQLQSMADEQGISLEELIQMLQTGEINTQDQEEETEPVDNPEEEDAENMFALGGITGRKRINVEGQEVLQTPDGTVGKVKGPKHESGGVDIVVPDGTKIYSDRVKIDGKTMQERKMKREKQLNKLAKALEANPTDRILKNTLNRTQEVLGAEEATDMAVQQAISSVAKPQKFAGGGIAGEDPNPLITYLQSLGYLPNTRTQTPFAPGFKKDDSTTIGTTTAGITKPDVTVGIPKVATRTDHAPRFTGTTTTEEAQPGFTGALTIGDAIGLGGNLFNAIAPIINTNNNAAGNKPNVNRFKGFGHEALDTNEFAQDAMAGLRSSVNTDLDTQANTAKARNRNSASSVNTLRALDAVTDIGTGKAKAAVNDNFAKQMIGLLGQRGEIEMGIDKVVMSGEAQRDIEDKADRDNYYSNMAANLVNFGTNVQGIGASLNVRHANQVDAKLLSQLSKYGLGFDDNGQLISIK